MARDRAHRGLLPTDLPLRQRLRGRSPEDLRINGALTQSGVAFPSTGGWTTWKDVAVTKALIAGSNKIRLTATTPAGAPNLDKLMVEP